MATIRIGIVGAGGRGILNFGLNFARQQADHVRLTALADPNRARMEAGCELLGAKLDLHTDPAEMAARKDLDAIVITSPDYLHEEHCLLALRHGKHVLVDKPLATTGAGCLRVIEAARRGDRVLYMGFNLRHDRVLRRLKDLVSADTFGRLFSMQAIEHYNGGRTYMSRWNRLRAKSGGLWIHKGSHDFDIINWVLAPARPVRVSCIANVSVLKREGLPFAVKDGVEPGPTCSACPYAALCPDCYPTARAFPDDADLSRRYAAMWNDKTQAEDRYAKDICMYLSDKDTHDQGIAIVEYDTGATASHSEYFATPVTNRHYLLEGTKGHVEADLHGNSIMHTVRWSEEKVRYNVNRPTGGHGGADPMMCAEFIRCVLSGERPAASGVDGAWSVAIGQACEISRAEKRMVEIRDVLDVKSDLLKPVGR